MEQLESHYGKSLNYRIFSQWKVPFVVLRIVVVTLTKKVIEKWVNIFVKQLMFTLLAKMIISGKERGRQPHKHA
jgi:hypothetical protein